MLPLVRPFMKCWRLPTVGVLAGVLAVSACATTLSAKPASEGHQQPAVGSDEQGSATPPAIFSRPPWRTIPAEGGRLVFIQDEARLGFPHVVAGLGLNEVRVYDQETNDIGFHYGAAVDLPGPINCRYALSVYIYPFVEALDVHLAKATSALLERSPRATRTDRVVKLDQVHGDAGVHVAFIDQVGPSEALEQISLYRRGRWFLKYRITFSPPAEQVCMGRLVEAVAALQLSP